MLKRRTSSMHQGEEIALERIRDYFYTKYGKNSRYNGDTFRINDATFIRFLRARDYDLERAVRMLESHLAFRDKWKPEQISSAEEKIKHGLTLHGGFWRIMGQSKQGSIVQMIDLENYDFSVYTKNSAQDFTRLLLYQNECVKRLIAQSDNPEAKTLLVFDYTKFSFAKHATLNALKLISVLADVMQNQYPEFLEAGVIYNAPRTFPLFWRSFLQEKMKHKVLFASGDELTLHIDPEHLETRFGGTRKEPYPITFL